ncbi:MAG: response regulator transcription factor [Anaerolineae bacterium]|nr:response regulator transcription factor [Anaerolineae bacterium]
MTHWLIVDPDLKFRAGLSGGLKSRGDRVTVLDDPYGLAAALAVNRLDAVLINYDAADGNTIIDVCEGLRSWSAIPLLVMSSSGEEALKVRILDAGADDYLLKPFGIDELLARLRAIQRRLTIRSTSPNPTITIGDLIIDLATRTVMLSGEPIHLTRKEYELLRVLALAQGKLVTYEKLLSDVWGEHKGIDERASVRTLVKQLRQKLREDHTEPAYLLTEPGVGYRLKLNQAVN